MNMLKVKIKRVDERAQIPNYAHIGDSGVDLRCLEQVRIPAGRQVHIKLGLAFQIPKGYELQIRPRSGHAKNHGLTITNTPATIDSTYRGEIGVTLLNLGKNELLFEAQAKIAQGVFAPVMQVEFEEADSLEETERGEDGFNSTGTY